MEKKNYSLLIDLFVIMICFCITVFMLSKKEK